MTHKKNNDLIKYESAFWSLGEKLVGGIDEAGRGPLAGPVVAACVIMPSEPLFKDINDSKRLTTKKRENLYFIIKEYAVDYCVSIVSADIIDKINILNAAKEAFVNSVSSLKIRPKYVLTDAMPLNSTFNCIELIKGDCRSYTVAAASILAKYTRDKIMEEYHFHYPEYGFNHNKGYGTKEHIAAILKYGITPIHRMSFLNKILN